MAKFAIDSDSGAITVASELDYEKEKKYTLVVIAKVREEVIFSVSVMLLIDVYINLLIY